MYKTIITCIKCFSNAFHILAYCSPRYMHACLGKDSKILAKIGNLYFLIAILNCRKKMSQIASTFKSQESHAYKNTVLTEMHVSVTFKEDD